MSKSTSKRLAVLFAMAGVLAGCVTTAKAPPPVAVAPAPSKAEPPVADPVAEVASGPASPAAQQQAQKSALAAAEMLEAGAEEQARAELQRALISDANNKLAHNLLRQMSVDPFATLGRESFSYVVKPGESLSKIAQRFLGDVYSFYLLARYNDIKVPRQLAGGQVIRVPGRAPLPAAPERETRRTDTGSPVVAKPPSLPPSDPVAVPVNPTPVAIAPASPEGSVAERAMRAGEAAERAGDLERALLEYRRAGDQAGAVAKAEQIRKQLVARHTVNARTAFAKQDLDSTIGQWDRVLDLDPGNETARLERRKAVGLKEKLQSVR